MRYFSRSLDPDSDLLGVAAFVMAALGYVPWWPFAVITALGLLSAARRHTLAKQGGKA